MPKNGLNIGKIIFGEMAGKSFLKKFKKISKKGLTNRGLCSIIALALLR